VVKRLPVLWTRNAIESLDEGLGFIAQFDAKVAHGLRQSILAGIERVREFPRSARVVPEGGNSNVREILREPFRIIYEIHPGELHILLVRRMERAPISPDDLD